MLAPAPVAWAQDAQSVMVQKIAREWLAMADKDDGEASWKAAGKKFQIAMPVAKWTPALADVHGPMGKVVQRAMIGTTFDKSFPGAPDGEYATVEYRTAFENRSDNHETVTLEHEGDGVWRVIGYSIH
jgi:hypothetical protein